MPEERIETAADVMQEIAALATNEVKAVARTDAQKADMAHQIYITWRNAYLRGMTTAAFAQVESGSAALIAAIAAAL